MVVPGLPGPEPGPPPRQRSSRRHGSSRCGGRAPSRWRARGRFRPARPKAAVVAPSARTTVASGPAARERPGSRPRRVPRPALPSAGTRCDRTRLGWRPQWHWRRVRRSRGRRRRRRRSAPRCVTARVPGCEPSQPHGARPARSRAGYAASHSGRPIARAVGRSMRAGVEGRCSSGGPLVKASCGPICPRAVTPA